MTNSKSSIPATLNDLTWMCGGWAGSLGPQSVAEAWSEPSGGTMSTMVRLMTDTETVMIELIAIRQAGNTLMLHLRQFNPELQLQLSQDMTLTTLQPDYVAFSATADSNIPMLAYRRLNADQMQAEVTVQGGALLAAILNRS